MWQKIILSLLFHNFCSALLCFNTGLLITSGLLCFKVGLLYYDQLCSDKTLLMKRCVSLLFMNSLFLWFKSMCQYFISWWNISLTILKHKKFTKLLLPRMCDNTIRMRNTHTCIKTKCNIEPNPTNDTLPLMEIKMTIKCGLKQQLRKPNDTFNVINQ